MVFVALSFLRSVPVHEEAHGEMNFDDGDEHDGRDAKGCDAAEQAHDQAKSAQELRKDSNGGKDCGNAKLYGHKVHGATKSVAAKPPKCKLCAVHKKHNAE